MQLSTTNSNISQPPTYLCLQAVKQQAPFTQLYHRLDELLRGNIEQLCLGGELLESIKQQLTQPLPLQFVEQHVYHDDTRFYEQIIFEDKQVPTRANWHDFFNGLVWLQFPLTKRYFNQVHYEEISEHGVKKRTAVRDRITHFDECGLVLFTHCEQLEHDIAEHNWQTVFVNNSAQWHRSIVPVIIGHALWEMLLNPHIGLTAKVKVCVLPAQHPVFSQTNTVLQSEINALLDQYLQQCLKRDQDFFRKKPWLPLPLLGIPQWSPFHQNAEFYANKNYFMEKRKTLD